MASSLVAAAAHHPLWAFACPPDPTEVTLVERSPRGRCSRSTVSSLCGGSHALDAQDQPHSGLSTTARPATSRLSWVRASTDRAGQPVRSGGGSNGTAGLANPRLADPPAPHVVD